MAACLLLSLISCTPTPAIRTEAVKVAVPVYVSLAPELIASAPMPTFPVELTNAALAQYTLDLQTALKIDIDKLSKIRALQPKGH